MNRPDAIRRILQEAAQRCGVVLPADADVAALGPRPRLGAVIDHFNPAHQRRDAECHAVGPYMFLPNDHALRRGEGTVRLTEKERDILRALILADGATVGRREMLESVWGYASSVETHTLETHIYRLRQKIEEDPANPALLLTEGDGYRLG